MERCCERNQYSNTPATPILLFSDYHSHPQGHRVQPYTQQLLQPWVDHARRVGLTDIAFTDHDRYHEGVSFDEIDRLRERNPDIKIRAGIELDNDPQRSAAGRNGSRRIGIGSILCLAQSIFWSATMRCSIRFRRARNSSRAATSMTSTPIICDAYAKSLQRIGRLSGASGPDQDPWSQIARRHSGRSSRRRSTLSPSRVWRLNCRPQAGASRLRNSTHRRRSSAGERKRDSVYNRIGRTFACATGRGLRSVGRGDVGRGHLGSLRF